MLDRWEITYFGSLSRSGDLDFDGDGMLDRQEDIDNSDPTDPASKGGAINDTDNDGMPDLWEVNYFSTLDRNGSGDFDNDGSTDLQEFQFSGNPLDPVSTHTNIDGDGLPDIWEFKYFGHLATSPEMDSDTDGFTNAEELVLGTDPNGTWKDYSIHAKINSTDNDTIGIMFRYIDEHNYYRFTWDAETQSRKLEKAHNGLFSVIASDNQPYVNSTDYQLTISVEQNTISLTIDGNLIFDINDSTHQYGGVGFYCRANQGCHFQDVLVDNPITGMTWVNPLFEDEDELNALQVIDDGTIQSPSHWFIEGAHLVQDSNIYGGDEEYGLNGTYALIKSTLGGPSDNDVDSLPDYWELIHFEGLSQSALNDFDSDGLTNLQEWELGTDPKDGISDGDDDGLADAWEIRYFGDLTPGRDEDSDNDGFTNAQEFTLGTDPNGVWLNYDIQMDIMSSDDDSIGVMFRFVDNNNYYRFIWDASNAVRRIERKYKGQFSVLAEDSTPYISNQTYSLLIQVLGEQISLSLDGQTIFNITDSVPAYGGVGLFCWANVSCHFDNILLMDQTSGNQWLSHAFDGSQGLDTFTIVDEGTISGPSSWAVSSTRLRQSSNIYGVASVNDGARGTYALLNQTLGEPSDNDNDQLLDAWELEHFGNIEHGGMDDSDSDGLSNLQEQALNTDPTNGLSDSDADGLSDLWELVNFGHLNSSSTDDPDADGLDNSLEQSFGTPPDYVSWADYRVDVELMSSDNDSIGIMFRYIDEHNYYRFTWDAQRKVRAIERNLDGISTVLASDAVPYSINTNYQVSITAIGDQLNISIDEVELFSVTDSEHAVGDVALFCWGNASCYYDNLLVTNTLTNVPWAEFSFSSAQELADFTVVDEGTVSGPSSWSLYNDRLRQSSNIYGGTAGAPEGIHGTFALLSHRLPGSTKNDTDSLDDLWEIQYFGNLQQIDEGDYDNDGLTNAQEQELGFDPTISVTDNDLDSLPDSWEWKYFGHLNHVATADPDNDGLSNEEELSLGTDPNGSWRNYDIQVDILSSDNDSIGVMFRYVDENNYYRFTWDRQRSVRQIERNLDGVFSVLASDTVTYSVNTTYSLTISAQDSQLSVSINDQLVLSAMDDSHVFGGIAFFCWANASGYFDTVLINNKDTQQTWLSQSFDDDASLSELTVVDEGTSYGPSSWYIYNNKLRQSSNIYGGTAGSAGGIHGTFALLNSTMAALSDNDNDQLADYWEISHFGGLQQNANTDPDSDGFSNALEFSANTDPMDGASFPQGGI